MWYSSMMSMAALFALSAVAQSQSVSIAEPKSIVVEGSVIRPGAYPFSEDPRHPESVVTILAQARGLTWDHGDVAYVLRNDKDGLRHTIEISLRRILEGRDPDVNLRPGDVVQVPERRKKRIKENTPVYAPDFKAAE